MTLSEGKYLLFYFCNFIDVFQRNWFPYRFMTRIRAPPTISPPPPKPIRIIPCTHPRQLKHKRQHNSNSNNPNLAKHKTQWDTYLSTPAQRNNIQLVGGLLASKVNVLAARLTIISTWTGMPG